ncbi:hypothetical protein NEFER03_0730 [Nematocida sp. LUAm3]|nr:hypothetical protein NEFER03_0730 [Nematocida sp. LUAm3]KAI5175189.1 hypothetical protein NEFER02_1150 [Nematocida sp. LUAm2]KAI5178139.1 hypothetical protein NEFER01_1317 [Nematocida sp. LUAm1]
MKKTKEKLFFILLVVSVIKGVPQEDIIRYLFSFYLGSTKYLYLLNSLLYFLSILILLKKTRNIPYFLISKSSMYHEDTVKVFLLSSSLLHSNYIIFLINYLKFLIPINSLFLLEKQNPLKDAHEILLCCRGAYLTAIDSHYGTYNGKQGSLQREVRGTHHKDPWILIKEEKNSPYIHIGDIVYLLNKRTNEYLHTFDVASPLTKTHQEVSCAPIRSSNSRFTVTRTNSDTVTHTNSDTAMHNGMRNGMHVVVSSGDVLFIKHVDTGVFLSTIRRRHVIEVSGEKAVGVDAHVGSIYATWTISTLRFP